MFLCGQRWEANDVNKAGQFLLLLLSLTRYLLILFFFVCFCQTEISDVHKQPTPIINGQKQRDHLQTPMPCTYGHDGFLSLFPIVNLNCLSHTGAIASYCKIAHNDTEIGIMPIVNILSTARPWCTYIQMCKSICVYVYKRISV